MDRINIILNNINRRVCRKIIEIRNYFFIVLYKI